MTKRTPHVFITFTSMTTQEPEREEIARLTKEFIARGGEIQKIESGIATFDSRAMAKPRGKGEALTVINRRGLS